MKRTSTVPVLGFTLVMTDNEVEAHRAVVGARTTIERYMAALHGHDAIDPEHESGGYVQDAAGTVVMCVEESCSAVHESVHAAWQICKAAGIKCDWHNQEPMAYYTQWVFDQWQEKMDGQA